MSGRRERIMRAAALAAEAELRAEARLAAANRAVSATDDERRELLAGASRLDAATLPPRLQSALASAGVARLDALAAERSGRVEVADAARTGLVDARARTRSLGRLADRLAAVEAERAAAADKAAYEDLLAARAARRPSRHRDDHSTDHRRNEPAERGRP